MIYHISAVRTRSFKEDYKNCWAPRIPDNYNSFSCSKVLYLVRHSTGGSLHWRRGVSCRPIVSLYFWHYLIWHRPDGFARNDCNCCQHSYNIWFSLLLLLLHHSVILLRSKPTRQHEKKSHCHQGLQGYITDDSGHYNIGTSSNLSQNG